jgi:hypothetical protein
MIRRCRRNLEKIAAYEQSNHLASADLMGYYLRFREIAIPRTKFSSEGKLQKPESVLAGIFIKTLHRSQDKL